MGLCRCCFIMSQLFFPKKGSSSVRGFFQWVLFCSVLQLIRLFPVCHLSLKFFYLDDGTIGGGHCQFWLILILLQLKERDALCAWSLTFRSLNLSVLIPALLPRVFQVLHSLLSRMLPFLELRSGHSLLLINPLIKSWLLLCLLCCSLS